jgi:uncharacterized protein (TIGR02246 family)
MRTYLPASFLLVVFAAGPLLAQNPAQGPCASPEFRQFDFWAGDWKLTWPASETSQGRPGSGTNRIEIALDGCVIVERFDGAPGMRLQGMSVSTFNARTGKWQQTWVDNFGSYLDFAGEFKDGQMILVREATAPGGRKFHQRMVWKNITPDALDWSWERSDDGGQTWRALWPIHYERIRAAVAPNCPEFAPADADAVRLANLAYTSAWLANDAEAVMRLFTEDAVLIPHHGVAPVEGKPAVRRHFWPPNSSFFRVDSFRMTPAEIGGCGDLAFARGRFSLQFTTEAGGKRQTLSNEGNYLMVFRRREGQWLISRYIWNDPPPRQP